MVTGGSWCWAFFFGAENRRAVGVFLEQKNMQRQFFFSRKESQIIFGYTFFTERFS